jgi:hypothetical protein
MVGPSSMSTTAEIPPAVGKKRWAKRPSGVAITSPYLMAAI